MFDAVCSKFVTVRAQMWPVVTSYLVIREPGHHTLEGGLSAQRHGHVANVLGDERPPGPGPAVHWNTNMIRCQGSEGGLRIEQLEAGA